MKSSVAKRGYDSVWENDAIGILIFFSLAEEVELADARGTLVYLCGIQ